MKKLQKIYSGKAKTLYQTDNNDFVIMQFRDDATAFNAKKHAQFANKGAINNQFSAFIMEKLKAANIPVHFEKMLGYDESLVKHLTMVPLECVVRNIAAGSICKRLGIEEGKELNPPVFEFFLKKDSLDDPMINESHIITFKWATETDIARMKSLAFQVNEILKPLFFNVGILLVDYKLEFGRFHGELVLGDEFTPDGCRLWDVKTKTVFDKDRFRRDLGDLLTGYREVAKRLGLKLVEHPAMT